MKLWILGKTGLLGKALIAACPFDFTATTRQEADITDFSSLERACARIKPTHIVNCTAFNDVDGAEKTPDLAFAVNALGPENIGKLGEKVIHISTDYVFDGTKNTPYTEKDPCNPINTYGKSKREGEIRLLAVQRQALIIRTSWLFGPGGKTFLSSLPHLLNTQTELKVVADQIGSPTYAPDLARFILSSLDQKGIVHFANSGGASRLEIAQYVAEICKKQTILLPATITFLAKRPAYSVLATHNSRSWKESIKEYVNAIC